MKSEKGILKHTELQTSANEIEVELISNSDCSEESISSDSSDEDGPADGDPGAEKENNIYVEDYYENE